MNSEEFRKARNSLLEGERRAWLQIVDPFDKAFRQMQQFSYCGKDRAEIFNEALEVFYKNIERDDFAITSTTTAYLLGVSKLICLHSRKRAKKDVAKPGSTEFDEMLRGFDPGTELVLSDDRSKEEFILLVRKGMEELGDKCKEMMKMRYYDDPPLPFRLIAEILAYGSDQIARSRFEDCKKRLRNYIRPGFMKLLN